MSALETRRKSNRWTRERTVSGTLCGSVVASTNSTCAGGSSSVFRNAFHASVVSMCASSMMYTLRRSEAGRYFTFSRRSRISSMPRLLAASISRTSTELPSRISRQAVHSLHGSPSRGARQLTARARMRAVDVLPGPADAGEQVRVRERAGAHLVAQRGGDDVLADEVRETRRSVPPVERSGHEAQSNGRECRPGVATGQGRGVRRSCWASRPLASLRTRHWRVLRSFGRLQIQPGSTHAAPNPASPATPRRRLGCVAPVRERNVAEATAALEERRRVGCIRSNSLRPDEGREAVSPL